MEENKGLIGQRILIILLVLVMCVVVFVGYILLKDDSQTENILATENILEDSEKEFTNIVSNEVEKNEDSETENVIITETNIIDDINNISDEKLEEIAKETLKEYLEYESYEKSNIGPMPYILVKLGFEKEEELNTVVNGYPYTEGYIKSNTNYDKFKNALLQYVTEDYFVRFFSQYRNIDGKVAFCDCAGGGIAIDVENVTLKSKSNNKYKFNIVFKDLEIYDHYLDGEELEDGYLFERELGFEYVNNRLVISEYNGQIILEGVYAMDASDVAYEFYKDGTVEYSTNLSVFKGTYNMSGENELRIDWEEKTEWDDITSEETVKKMSGREYVDVIDDKNIIVRTELEGKTYKNEFVKLDS